MKNEAMKGSFLVPAAKEKMENFNGRRNYNCKQTNLSSFDQDPQGTLRPCNVFLQAALNKMATRDEAWSDVTNRQTRRRATHTGEVRPRDQLTNTSFTTIYRDIASPENTQPGQTRPMLIPEPGTTAAKADRSPRM